MSDPTSLALEALLEAVLFAFPQPVTVEQLANALQYPKEDIEAALARLDAHLQARGLRLQRHRDAWQLTSAPEAAPYIERLAGAEVTLRLSQAALETLAMLKDIADLGEELGPEAPLAGEA